MSPRRKKGADEETTPVGGGLEAAPKKPRASRKKVVTEPEASAGLPPAPRQPVSIPIRPIPAQIVVPPRMTIEPERRLDGEVEEFWKPAPRSGTDLSSPPRVLLQRQGARQEVEDALDDPEDMHESDREGLRPNVRTGLFRKIALGFSVPVLLIGAAVAYAVYAHATVLVYPQKAEIRSEQDLSVAGDVREGDVPGQVAEVTVGGDRTEAPSGATPTDGTARGTVTLVNGSGNDQTLVATTRLLTSDGILFRLKSRANVPAHGHVAADAYADRPGASGNIGPTTFTIPGLSADLQKLIYASSDAAMTGGVVSSGTISQADIDRAENGLRDQLTRQAEDELAKTADPKWTGHSLVAETMTRSVSAAPGQEASGVTVRLTLRVRSVDFDRDKALALAVDDMKRGLTSERELTGVDTEHAELNAVSADPKAGTASLHARLKGESQVSLSGPLFDASKLRGLGLKDVEGYFDGIEGVEKIEVKFRPFWLKRMPLLPDRIDFQIQK